MSGWPSGLDGGGKPSWRERELDFLKKRTEFADSSDYEFSAFYPHRGAAALPMPSPKETQVLPADIDKLHEEMRRLASLRSKGDDSARGQSQRQQPSSSGPTREGGQSAA